MTCAKVFIKTDFITHKVIESLEIMHIDIDFMLMKVNLSSNIISVSLVLVDVDNIIDLLL